MGGLAITKSQSALFFKSSDSLSSFWRFGKLNNPALGGSTEPPSASDIPAGLNPPWACSGLKKVAVYSIEEDAIKRAKVRMVR